MSKAIKTAVHKHFEMGKGKYRLVGMWSMPGNALLESSPVAYVNQMSSKPRHCKGRCDHCGTPILHHFLIEDENLDRFSVGSSCIAKLKQVELVTAVQKLKKERKREITKAKAEQKVLEKKAAYEDELESQRKKNGGRTDFEMKVLKREELEASNEIKFQELSEPITTLLEKAGGNFCNDMIQSLMCGQFPTGGRKLIIIEVMAKQHTGARKNSKAYNAAFPEMKRLLESIESQYTEINEQYYEFLKNDFVK